MTQEYAVEVLNNLGIRGIHIVEAVDSEEARQMEEKKGFVVVWVNKCRKEVEG